MKRNNLILKTKFTGINSLKDFIFINTYPDYCWIVFKFKANVTIYLCTASVKYSSDYVSFIASNLFNPIKGFESLNGAVKIFSKKSIKIDNESLLDEIEMYRNFPINDFKTLLKCANTENKEITREINKLNLCLTYNNEVIDALNQFFSLHK